MTGFKVDFKCDTKGFGAELKRASKEAFEQGVKKEMARLRCPVHHKSPSVKFRSSEAEISGCCEQLDALVKKSFR